MSYPADFQLAVNDGTFMQRVEMAMVSAAIDIATEDPTTVNHANRIALVKAVANNPRGYAVVFAPLCAVDGMVTLASTDLAFKNRCAAVWEVVAGKP